MNHVFLLVVISLCDVMHKPISIIICNVTQVWVFYKKKFTKKQQVIKNSNKTVFSDIKLN